MEGSTRFTALASAFLKIGPQSDPHAHICATHAHEMEKKIHDFPFLSHIQAGFERIM